VRRGVGDRRARDAAEEGRSDDAESAAVACLYAFVVTMFIYRDYRWAELPMLLHWVTKMVAMVMMLIGFSAAFGYMMALTQVPAKATQFFVSIASNKYELLMMINILLIALGTFMDMAPMILICTPFYGAMCMALLIVTDVPALSLWLSHLIAK
jgi:TRAP-type C4-dicarboxylate transport system permease large subunit